MKVGILMKQNKPKYNKTTTCDFCGKKAKTRITHYGTRECYNRLICEACDKRLNNDAK